MTATRLRDWITCPQDWGGWGTKANAWFNEMVDTFSHSDGRDQAVAHSASNQAITDSTYTLVTFATEIKTPDGFEWNGSDNELTIPCAGLYLVEASVRWASNNVGQRIITIASDKVSPGTPSLATDSVRAANQETMGNTGTFVQHITACLELDDDNTVSTYVWQSSGGNLNVESASAYTHMRVTRIR